MTKGGGGGLQVKAVYIMTRVKESVILSLSSVPRVLVLPLLSVCLPMCDSLVILIIEKPSSLLFYIYLLLWA